MRKREKLAVDELSDEEIRDAIRNMRQLNDSETRLVRLLDELALKADDRTERSAADPQIASKAA